MPFRGLIVPLATPFTESAGVDAPALERLIEHIQAAGGNGLFLLGTTGEAPSLSLGARRAVVRHAATCASGLELLVCVTDTCLDDSLELARCAAEIGAAAIVAAPPSYFPLSDVELVDYFLALARGSPLPLLLYNIPATARASLSPRVVGRLAQEPKIVGLKDSSGDLQSFAQTMALVRSRPDFAMLVGSESALIDGLGMGAHGGVCGTANLCPRIFRGLLDEVGCDASAARRWRDRLTRVHRLYLAGSSWSRHVANIKWMLEQFGLCRRAVAPPLAETAGEAAAFLTRLLGEWRADEDLAPWLPAIRAGRPTTASV